MLDASVHRLLRAFGMLAVGVSMVVGPSVSLARGPVSAAETDTVALAQLPSQARTTHRLILQGGPFPYDKDGSVFFNRERLLPAQPRGHYREYTVKTPWARDRGARRIVCAGQQPTVPDACYYTSDHYNSFRKISP